MKSRFFNICNLYALLWMIMNLKGSLYTSDLVSVVAYIIIVSISFYFFVKCFTKYHPPIFVRVYNVLFIFLVIYGLINYFAGDIDSHLKIPKDFYLQKIVKSMLPFYAFYAFAKKGMITKIWLCFFGGLFLLVSIAWFYTSEIELANRFSKDVGEFTNNAGYIFVTLIPYCLFWDKSKIIQYVMMAVCCFFIISSMKRGAVVTGVICLVFFFWASLVRKVGFKHILVIGLSIALVDIGYQYINNLMETNTFFVNRVSITMEGYSSGRDFLYEHYWNMFLNESNPFYILFGHGADATIRSGYNYAHNDWLEILINQGLIGIIIFIIFWICFFQMWCKLTNSILKVAFGMCFATLFLKTFFSMSINDMSIYSTLIMGMGTAAYENHKILQLITTSGHNNSRMNKKHSNNENTHNWTTS